MHKDSRYHDPHHTSTIGGVDGKTVKVLDDVGLVGDGDDEQDEVDDVGREGQLRGNTEGRVGEEAEDNTAVSTAPQEGGDAHENAEDGFDAGVQCAVAMLSWKLILEGHIPIIPHQIHNSNKAAKSNNITNYLEG